MRIAFFGTPDFAIPSLKALSASPNKLIGVVTAPDRPRGRGREIIPTPVAYAAADLGLPVLKPEKLVDGEFIEVLREWRAEAFAVVAFRILPVEVFGLPERGAINLHGSLLPKYRGAAPIQWALMNGDQETGLTTFQIQLKVDTGNILKQRRVEIQEDDDAGSLGIRMAQIGAELLVETLTDLELNNITPISQNPELATNAPKITQQHQKIDWQRPALQIHNQIRALAPLPAAYSMLEGLTIKLYRATVATGGLSLDTGMMEITDRGIFVGTGDGVLSILELQLQGKKRMDVQSFLRGYRPRGLFQLNHE